MDQNENRDDNLFDFSGQNEGSTEPPQPASEPVILPAPDVQPEGGARVYAAPPEPAPVFTPPPVTPAAAPPVRSSSSRTWLIVLLVIVVLCCCLVGFLAFMYFVGGDVLLDMLSWGAPLLLVS